MSRRETRVVFLDALGTLVDLDPPWVHLAAVVGLRADDPRLIAAVRAEMAYYREHAVEGSDEASLRDLRERCASLLSTELGTEVGSEAMMAAIRFRSFPDSEPALRSLRERGLGLIVVSNWDASLPEVLERAGVAGLLDGCVTSAEVGASKPDPALFERALEVAGCERGQALHVGDTPSEDIEGARAAGIRALLLDRSGGGDIASLAEIEAHL